MTPFDVFSGLLTQAKIRLLVVGGMAVNAHGFTRLTVDVDGLIATDDLEMVADAFQSAGYSETTRNHLFARFHRPDLDPGTVDVLLVSRQTMDKIWPDRIVTEFRSHELPIPKLEHLFALKLHAVRNDPKRWGGDLRDIQELIRSNPGVVTRAKLVELCERFGPPGQVKEILQFVFGHEQE
jgi:hypothetical protein